AIKEGTIKANEVAYYVAQLNKVLYRIFVEELKIDKGDVVRVSIDYDLEPGKIIWKFDTLKIEAFRRIPDTQVEEIVRRVATEAEAIMAAAVEYTIEKLGETADGDIVYVLRLGDREVGAFEVVMIDEEMAYIKKGAAIEPSPMVIEKIKIMTEGRPVEEAIRGNIAEFTRSARYVSEDEAKKLIDYIKGRILGPKPEEAEEVEEG
ncbi:MAG: DUF2258 domain-containing protein, partial [Thermoprotei archaeon]